MEYLNYNQLIFNGENILRNLLWLGIALALFGAVAIYVMLGEIYYSHPKKGTIRIFGGLTLFIFLSAIVLY
jgi:hypothetical protein